MYRENTKEQVKECVRSMIEPTVESGEVIPVTTGMTLDATWDDIATDYDDLVNAEEASCRVDMTLNASDSGVIMEAGAAGSGTALYAYNGVLYLQTGNGGDYGTSTNRIELSWNIVSGTYVIEWSISNTGGKAALYIDGSLVDVDSYSSPQKISGGDTGGTGAAHSNICANRGGWSGDGAGAFTGTVGTALIYIGEVTNDVSA